MEHAVTCLYLWAGRISYFNMPSGIGWWKWCAIRSSNIQTEWQYWKWVWRVVGWWSDCTIRHGIVCFVSADGNCMFNLKPIWKTIQNADTNKRRTSHRKLFPATKIKNDKENIKCGLIRSIPRFEKKRHTNDETKKRARIGWCWHKAIARRANSIWMYRWRVLLWPTKSMQCTRTHVRQGIE